MKIFTETNLDEIPEKTVNLTIGNFDGLHLGHRDIVENLKELCLKNKRPSCVLTFSPHPSKFFQADSESFFTLFSKEDLFDQLRDLKIDYLIVLNFNKYLAQQSALNFFKYLDKFIDIDTLVVGHDFKIGCDQENLLLNCANGIHNEYNFNVKEIEAFKSDAEIVSSTVIRNALAVGDFCKIKNYLKRPYYIQGIVTFGNQIGSKNNVPTMNIDHENLVYIKSAVYAGFCELDGKTYKAIANNGMRPTITDSNNKVFEVHLLEASGNFYHKKIKFNFIKKIRDEKKFSTEQQLFSQIKLDIISAKEILDYHN